jgi:hypothetical protein
MEAFLGEYLALTVPCIGDLVTLEPEHFRRPPMPVPVSPIRSPDRAATPSTPDSPDAPAPAPCASAGPSTEEGP